VTEDAPGVDSTAVDSGVDTGNAGDTGNTGDTGTTGDTGNAGDTGNGGDTGSAGDAGDAANAPDAPGDAAGDVMLVADTGGTLTDAAPGGDGAALNCGNETCNLPVQSCCLYPLASPPPAFFAACSTGGACPATLPPDAGYEAGAPTSVGCEVQSNCTGVTVCCLESSTSGSVKSSCRAAGSCVGSDAGVDGATGLSVALLCDPSLGGDAGCGEAGACSGANIGTWNLPSGFGTCGGLAR
jgi:hypothetical protein